MLTLQGMAFAGEQLLVAGEVFAIRPLQLYAVTEQLQQGKPTCASGDAKTDLGHILDFTCRLKYLKVKLHQLSCGCGGHTASVGLNSSLVGSSCEGGCMGHPGKEGHLLGSRHCAAGCELQGAVVIQCPLL